MATETYTVCFRHSRELGLAITYRAAKEGVMPDELIVMLLSEALLAPAPEPVDPEANGVVDTGICRVHIMNLEPDDEPVKVT